MAKVQPLSPGFKAGDPIPGVAVPDGLREAQRRAADKPLPQVRRVAPARTGALTGSATAVRVYSRTRSTSRRRRRRSRSGSAIGSRGR